MGIIDGDWVTDKQYASAVRTISLNCRLTLAVSCVVLVSDWHKLSCFVLCSQGGTLYFCPLKKKMYLLYCLFDLVSYQPREPNTTYRDPSVPLRNYSSAYFMFLYLIMRHYTGVKNNLKLCSTNKNRWNWSKRPKHTQIYTHTHATTRTQTPISLFPLLYFIT